MDRNVAISRLEKILATTGNWACLVSISRQWSSTVLVNAISVRNVAFIQVVEKSGNYSVSVYSPSVFPCVLC
jgi:hypothetical protein